MVTRTRILLAEDHAATRDRVLQALEPEFEVVGVVDNGKALLEAADKTRHDVLVINISLPVLSGIEAADQLRHAGSTAKLVFLTTHEDPDFVRAALRAGALGYVIKSRLASDLHAAIREALAGRWFVSPCVLIPPETPGEM